MRTQEPGATAPTRKTSHNQFFSCNPDRDMLFSVREGIPANDALQMASCFLASAQDIASAAAQDEEGDRMWGAYYLIAMAKAAVDASVEAIHNEERGHE